MMKLIKYVGIGFVALLALVLAIGLNSPDFQDELDRQNTAQEVKDDAKDKIVVDRAKDKADDKVEADLKELEKDTKATEAKAKEEAKTKKKEQIAQERKDEEQHREDAIKLINNEVIPIFVEESQGVVLDAFMESGHMQVMIDGMAWSASTEPDKTIAVNTVRQAFNDARSNLGIDNYYTIRFVDRNMDELAISKQNGKIQIKR